MCALDTSVIYVRSDSVFQYLSQLGHVKRVIQDLTRESWNMSGAYQGDGDRQQRARDENTPSYICDSTKGQLQQYTNTQGKLSNDTSSNLVCVYHSLCNYSML